MILVFDVGNTNIVLGVFKGRELVENWRLSSARHRTADEYGMLLKDLFETSEVSMGDIRAGVLSSVVPTINPVLEQTCQRYFGIVPHTVGPGTKTGMPIKYENPREVGADRIVNAVAGYDKYGGPLIIVDFGTATTFCVISAKGEYLGGAIAPGIGISTEALFARAAKLPRVELVKPPSVIGKNTVNSMQSGILYGFVGQVNEIVRRIKDETGGNPLVIATGGLAELIASETPAIDRVDRDLTLYGLRIIYERNCLR
ncbi:type III pantothenate kinase [Desulfallas thermosapovorans]|uniref:Type III pantothenate kinase n=1 Tax=Desulfallas thermosapovorans DSM 6562 TaxID=1121431 RepID=A0A5S4ZPP1_9FIRM|nr:type III pantothenate kinase [Desulfallas thermosapovorans]TYO94625.1 type III pantothenate kinase [Desulfallas thermosapovorans DSM 6562]